MARSPSPKIPDSFDRSFLTWLGGASEQAWGRVRERTLADYERAGVGGNHWRRGTRWTGGLSDAEIEAIESRLDVRFPADHRLFLQVLHATEPWRGGACFGAGDHMLPVDSPGFYHWQRDETELHAASADVLSGLLFDVENNDLWRDSWGRRPDHAADRHDHVATLVARAPRLLPIYGHRYVLAEGPTLVLSVHQSDIIVYGVDLRDYLLHELGGDLGIRHRRPATSLDTTSIPFWGELIG